MAMATYAMRSSSGHLHLALLLSQASSNEDRTRWIQPSQVVSSVLYTSKALLRLHYPKKFCCRQNGGCAHSGNIFAPGLQKQVRSNAACLDCCCKERAQSLDLFVWQLSVSGDPNAKIGFAFVEHPILRKRMPQTVPQTYPKVVKMRQAHVEEEHCHLQRKKKTVLWSEAISGSM